MGAADGTSTVGSDASKAPAAVLAGHAEPLGVAQIYRDLAPAVVRVTLIDEELDADKKNIVWIVTGFIVTPEGRVLTSLGSSTRILRAFIEKDGLQYSGEFLGGDLQTKLALVQLNKMPEKIAVIPIDEGPDQPLIGTSVVALTFPFQLEVSPSPGLVTGFESEYAQYVFPCTQMRTNIPLLPGETGAPLIDLQGNLTGVLVHSVPELRSSYALTMDSIRRVVSHLDKTGGPVIYGTLPIEFSEGPNALYVDRQVVISAVQSGSSAERAGLRVGDVVRSLGDVAIKRLSQVRDILFHAKPGDFIRIVVERDGQAIPFFTLRVEALANPPEPKPEQAPASASPSGTPN